MRAFRSIADHLIGFFTGSARFKRIHERLPCAVWSKLHFIDRGFNSVGIVDEISQGGMRFRPAQSYICIRMGDIVCIQANDYSIKAIIVNTTEYGYGLKLKEYISAEDILKFITSPDTQKIAA